MRSFSLVLAFLFFALPVGAKDFYIAAKQAGTGTGTGCSTAQPLTWLSNAASWGTGAGQIGPGTTVHLCGTFTGTPGQQLFLVRGNGTSTSPITIKWETNAVLTSPYWSAMGAIYAAGRSYIVFDGGTNGIIRNTANGTGRAYVQNSRAIYADTCSNCTVKNLTIADMYVRTSNSDVAVTQTDVNCVHMLGATNFTISHMTCHDAGWAVAGAGNNFTLEYSNIYNIDHGLAFGAQGKTSGFWIHDNHIHGYTNWDSPTNAYHHDGLHLWGQNGGTVTNGAIYNNLFDGDSGVNITAHIYLQDSIQNVTVYNNVFVAPANRTIVVLWFAARSTSGMPGGSAIGNSAYNNFINAGGHAHGSALYIESQLNFSAHNNVLMGGQSDITIQGGGTLSSTGINRNVYLELADYGDRNTFGHNGLVYQTLAQWQSVCRCDTNSKLVHLSQINANSLGQLLSGSVAISAATNLINITTGNLAALSKDKVGAARQVTGNWDAGAYKYGSVALPSSPTGLSATIQ
ncbi:MAG TPA: hypothetical protein VN943_19125 [Candidatus Acidoferrum sp.]|nr:hypothetical protein [Candidatus Acidoferrum sp.]